MTHVAAFVGVSVLVIVTPGPDTALTIRNALLRGRAGGIATAAGVATGQAVWTLAAAAGVAALLRASGPAFVALRIAGAAYLAWLGASALLAAVRGRELHPPVGNSSRNEALCRRAALDGPPPRPRSRPYLPIRALPASLRRTAHRTATTKPHSETSSAPRARRPAYRQGLLSNLGNPKMAVFFTSLLPQFGGTSFAALLALGLVFCSMTLVWLSVYACVVAKAGDVLRRSRVRRALDAVTGAVLVALGVRLATERA